MMTLQAILTDVKLVGVQLPTKASTAPHLYSTQLEVLAQTHRFPVHVIRSRNPDDPAIKVENIAGSINTISFVHGE